MDTLFITLVIIALWIGMVLTALALAELTLREKKMDEK
jgi:hypothetical protein